MLLTAHAPHLRWTCAKLKLNSHDSLTHKGPFWRTYGSNDGALRKEWIETIVDRLQVPPVLALTSSAHMRIAYPR